MKTLRLIFYILILSLLFSCSSDNDSNPEFPIGEWKVTKRVVSGQEIELNVCDAHVIYFFRDDFVLGSYLNNQNGIPSGTACLIWMDFLYKWEIIEENKFGQTHACCPDNIITIYEKVGSKLIAYESPDDWVEYTRR